tara:strand:+ start:567 stop:1364 length:798 start_codon:yes stop_codon:yes gene_type:complete
MPKDKFSFSKINTFNNCREQYYIHYILNIRKPNENIEAFLGSCVHEVIEFLYEEKKSEINFDKIIDLFDKIWKKKWHNDIYLIDKRRKVYQYYNLGVECLRNFFRKNIQNNPNFFSNTTDCELSVEFEIEGINFRGIIDRLDFDSDKNQYIINDYKTSKRIISNKKAIRDLQLGLYLIAIHKKYKPTNPVNLRWYFLRYGIEILVQPKLDDQNYIKQKLIQKAKSIIDYSNKSESFYANETILCNWCHYWEECRAKTSKNPARRI